MPKYKTKDGTFDIKDSEVAEFLKDYPEATLARSVISAGSSSSAAEEAERQKYINSHPDKTVTQKQYDDLMDLYKKAEAADATGTKKTKESETFQRAYHEILPGVASYIIAKHGVKTRKARDEGRTWWDLEGNADGYFGPRTKQYMEELKKKKPTENVTEIAPTPPLKEDTKEKDGPVDDKVIVSHGGKERRLPPVPPAWWLQDKNKMLNAGLNYMGIKAYNPWEAQATYMTPRTTYLSPERALGENQSQMNMAMNSLAQFNKPQQVNARMTDISGKGFANAANTIADVHNRNIQMFNQNSAQEAAIKNTEARERAGSATSMWDKYQTVRQNFDAAKVNARNVMVDTFNQAITNRANTYNMNQTNPQYAVNPRRGGTMYFHDGRDLKASQANTPISQRYQQMLRDNSTMAKTEEGQKRLWEMTKIEAGMPGDDMAEYQRSRQRGAGNQTPTPAGYPSQDS